MNVEDLKLEVKAKVTVDEDTAERCRALLSIYLTDNPNVDLEVRDCESVDSEKVVRYLTFITTPKERD